MDIMPHAKFHFNRLMLTLIFCIRASEPTTRAWRMTEKVGPDRFKTSFNYCSSRNGQNSVILFMCDVPE